MSRMLRSHFERGVAKLRQLLAGFQSKQTGNDECRVPEERDECSRVPQDCCDPCGVTTDGQDRDLVNFPRPVRHEHPPPVKFGVIPESWFTFFYHKTGVTGPYAFGVAVTTYLVSKELYVLEHNYYNGLSVAALCTYGVKTLGKQTAAYCDKQIDNYAAHFQQWRKDMEQYYEDAIAEERVLQWQAMGEKSLIDAKRQMVATQLEAEFRERQMAVHNEVKQRLDIEVSLENVRKRVNLNHLRGWLAAQVASTVRVDEDLQRRILVNCIETLKGLKGRDQGGTSTAAVADSLAEDEIPDRKVTTVNMSATKLTDVEELEAEEGGDTLYLT